MAVANQPISAWRLKDFDPGEGLTQRASDVAVDGADWIDIPAPGDVYLALHAAGRIPDPLGDRVEPEVAWVADHEWWCRADLAMPNLGPDERLILDFQGLDTFAAIYLNGEQIGASDNMFVPAVLDITGKVAPGLNRIAVRFDPLSIVKPDPEAPVWPVMAEQTARTRRNLMRKAQFGWGWDWGPTLPTVGIWGPATLRVERAAALQSVKFTTVELSASRDRAKVSIAVVAETFAGAAPLSAQIVLATPNGDELTRQTLDFKDGEVTLDLALDDPALWWTPDLGAAALHDLSVTLLSGGQPVDSREIKVGVRTIALDTSPDPDEAGASFFRFVLNGVPIFARGVCWIPASSFVGAVDEPHYRKLLTMAAEANMNMIRIWGGGVYEHDAFYDVCDELGLLVWQDFMFACAPYPEHRPEFVDSVRAEVRAQIERLRHHPSMAVWCGNNENQLFQVVANRINRRDDPTPGDLYYQQIMPQAVAELDPTTPYWPGSPYGGPTANSQIAGDVHDWTVWHGVPPIPVDRPVGKMDLSPQGVAYTRYAEDMTRFCSEYGIQASPVMETLLRALPAGERALDGPALLNRIKDVPKNKVDGMLIPVTGLPQTLDQYVDFTQITQAEGLKFGIEHFRRRTPHCSGSLIWQYNDCWPGISWSLVDYYGFGKASYFYVRRAYAPVMASFKILDDGMVELWVVNDTLTPAEGRFDIALHTFSLRDPWTAGGDYSVGTNQSLCVWSGKVAGGPDKALTVTSPTGQFPANRWFFTPIKDLERAAPSAPEVTIAPHGQDLAVTITAPTYLYFVHLLVAHDATWFSDNYFDLAAGETRTIIVRNPVAGLTPEDVTVRWR